VENQFESLVEKSIELGALEAKLIDTNRVVFDPRSELQCRFGCPRWGNYWTCPPNLNLSQDQFKEAFKKYKKAIVIKTADQEAGQEVAVAIEKKALLSYGCSYSFALALCVKCEECAFPEPCLFPHLARPSMDAFGIDFNKTLGPVGFKVEFDKDGKLLPAWYSMVLLD